MQLHIAGFGLLFYFKGISIARLRNFCDSFFFFLGGDFIKLNGPT